VRPDDSTESGVAARAVTLAIMLQQVYEPIHDDFRALCREFLAREAVPYHAEWEKAGLVDRDVWRKAGAAGLLGFDVAEEYGGAGRRLPVQRGARRGDHPRGLLRPRLRPAQRRGRALSERADHRGAAQALAAGVLLR
jgi:hypothetical protein